MTLDLCSNIQQFLGLDVMMHLTCTNMPSEKVCLCVCADARARVCVCVCVCVGANPPVSML